MKILSERLELIPLNLSYAKDMYQEFTDEITEFMNASTPIRIEETIAYIKSMLPKIKSGEELPVVILNLKTKEFVGCGGVHLLKSRYPRLGIWIKKSEHGKGYGKEAVSCLSEWAKNNLEFEYLTYPVDKKNIRSRKIAESLGGAVGREYKKKDQSGKILDEVEYWIYKK